MANNDDRLEFVAELTLLGFSPNNIAPGVERLDRVDVSMGLALNALNIISMRNVPIFWTYSDKAIKNYVQENANKVPAN